MSPAFPRPYGGAGTGRRTAGSSAGQTITQRFHKLKMNPLILLGACSGAGTITAALQAIKDEAHSKLPALGYTVPYAIGNILLTAWGPVIMAMRHEKKAASCDIGAKIETEIL
jgi:hypothetical protein